MELQDAEAYVMHVTHRTSIKDALAWLSEERAVSRPIVLPKLLASLLTIEEQASAPEIQGLAIRVIRQVCRTQVVSELDPSQELLALDEVMRPADYKAALDALAARTETRTLVSMTLAAVTAAQKDDRNVVTALCSAAGLSYRDLRARVRDASVPTDLRGNWKNDQIKAVFEVIDAVITGRVTASIPAAQPARPVEHLLPDIDDEPARERGWALVEQMRVQGVPYGLLLAQRAVGSAWVAHRSSTGKKLQAAVTTSLCELLDQRSVPFDRLAMDGASRALLTRVGANPAHAAEDGRNEGGQLAVLVHTPMLTHAVAVSVARDGGTARKSGARLGTLTARLGIDCSVVLVGPGWAERNTTSELARPFHGRIYTERTIADLADALSRMVDQKIGVVPAGQNVGTQPATVDDLLEARS
ncbi:hypothetical protein [Catellatospora paridis]|uniref:hypothetical protein n=1 Tax=Catellatospora paridis TaxID=1617086 RepID=UPI0012D4A2ED|nr:hypothetical protein [Catellatospora paridis]